MSKEKIAIVGAGPGGLTAGMLLSAKGYDVSIYELAGRVGGRNRSIQLGDYTFDTGPTFLMMTFILEQVFQESGRKIEDHLDLVRLDPMYKLSFSDKHIYPSADAKKMREEIKRVFPGNEIGFDRFLKREKVRYEKMYPCLQRPYSGLGSYLSPTLLKAVPHLSLGKSLYDNLSTYFTDEECKMSFTFQAKYLGMSPWECPALFTMIPFVEYNHGVDHVIGGLSRISDVMADIIKENGGHIHLSTGVEKVLLENDEAKGLILKNGEKVLADSVIINADFGHAATHLFEPGQLKKYTPEKLEKKKFSCSTFMIYLGIDKLYDEPHHNIIFANDYKSNIDDIAVHKRISDDMSIYVRNASINDKTIAPKGHSALYVLVPITNNSSGIEWEEEMTKSYRDKVIARIQERTSMKDLSEHIVEEQVITPRQWEEGHNVFLGATFNLGHQLSQMLHLRPHNKFEECKNVYLVGGGTHPGSGLPTIYESARITRDLITQAHPL